MWGNSVTPVTLSGFSARFVPGRTSLPEISGETKLQALTVPRFRRDDLPRHALLAANGDVLRGEIEAATASHFGFRSGLENLRVPRDRVTAVIWLKPPDKDAPPATMKPAAPNPLDQKISRRTRYSRGNLKSFSSFLQAEAAGLKFKFPEKDDPRQFPMQFGGQTIADALEEICSLYGLRYRLEDGNMIVFETAPQVSKDLVQKVYWLKPAALPSAPPAQEILTAKGVAFPAKATALWEPEARQLTMTNTAANHARLAEVLAADFGGSLGSPTHWLILTSGARLGLAVDKFDTDFISGNHPIYGRCKVPMSDVYVIRTSPPEPAAGRKSLADWRLVLAPEPVLPDTGGESSPSLGKEAKGFKLPLLGGGDFDLAKEKGKVVVLDFWATWCGPCIKALPGLIEALSALPADRVKLIGVNQSEPADQVKRFLETRGWKLTVALDAGQAVARQYGVEGIPHTVIIGPDGKVAWVKTGYSPDGAEEAAKAAMQLLTPTAP
jgi:thiol-disulfide isomerase/thioredoxin